MRSQCQLLPIRAEGAHLTAEQVDRELWGDDIHIPRTSVVGLENTLNGSVFPHTQMRCVLVILLCGLVVLSSLLCLLVVLCLLCLLPLLWRSRCYACHVCWTVAFVVTVIFVVPAIFVVLDSSVHEHQRSGSGV